MHLASQSERAIRDAKGACRNASRMHAVVPVRWGSRAPDRGWQRREKCSRVIDRDITKRGNHERERAITTRPVLERVAKRTRAGVHLSREWHQASGPDRVL